MEYDGIKLCEQCGEYTTGRLCNSCAQQELIDNDPYFGWNDGDVAAALAEELEEDDLEGWEWDAYSDE